MANSLQHLIESGENYVGDHYKIEAFIHSNNEGKPVQGSIAYNKLNLDWNWCFDLRYFESIYAMSTIVKLLPNKICMALDFQNNFEDEDGSFFIQMFSDFVGQYLDSLQDLKVDDVAKTRTLQIFSHENNRSVSAKQGLDFKIVCADYFAKLKKLEQSFLEKNNFDIFDIAEELLVMSDDIWRCCRVFLDLVCPIIQSITKRAVLEEININPKRQKLITKLAKDQGSKIFNKFLRLSRLAYI